MYQVPGFGSVDISSVVGVGVSGYYVTIRLSDGNILMAEADFDEVLRAIRAARIVENSEDHEEMLEDLCDLWSKNAY